MEKIINVYITKKQMILNTTTNQIISQKEIYCKTFLSQTLGLMFQGKKNLVMIFSKERHVSLHNFFVFYPLKVILLDEKKRAVEVKENFKPFTFWRSKKKGKYLLEIAKPVTEKDVSLDDVLGFKE